MFLGCRPLCRAGEVAYGKRVTGAVESWAARRLGAVVLAAMVVMVGCSGEDDDEPFPLDTMPAPTSPSVEDPSPTEASTGQDVELPQECGAFISYSDVVQTVGVPMSGGVTPIFVDGGFHEDSGRLQRLTCRYSWVEDADDAEDEAEQILEISVSSYVDDEHAADRVRETVDSTSSEVEPTDVSGVSGYVLRGDETTTYVAANGPYTYVASLLRAAMRDEALEDTVLILLAEQLLGALEPEPEPTPTS